jgi:PIN domain nuclease of toxin-antitoxin system
LIVFDTHAFFWWVTGSRRLSRPARAAIERSRALIVPSIVLWELLLLAEKGRIKIDRPPLEWSHDALERPGVEVAEITAEIASQAIAFRRIVAAIRPTSLSLQRRGFWMRRWSPATSGSRRCRA